MGTQGGAGAAARAEGQGEGHALAAEREGAAGDARGTLQVARGGAPGYGERVQEGRDGAEPGVRLVRAHSPVGAAALGLPQPGARTEAREHGRAPYQEGLAVRRGPLGGEPRP